MRILTLISKFPWPLTDGAVIRDFNLLREAAKRHDVSLLCFLFEPTDREYFDALLPYCSKIVGIDLVFSGLALLMIMLAVRKAFVRKETFCIGGECFSF